MQPRYKCNICGHMQEAGAWESAMDARAKAMGSKGFINLSANPECLNCGSTDLEDLLRPVDGEKRQEKVATKTHPERTQLMELLKEWDNIDRPTLDEIRRLGHTQKVLDRHMKVQTREGEIGIKIREMGENLAARGGQELMYLICTSLERRDWQNRVSAYWDGIAGWIH